MTAPEALASLPWAAARAGDLAVLVGGVMAEERLTVDELSAACWDDPDPVAVWGDESGTAALAAVMRGGALHIRLVAVAEGCRRQGRATALVAAAEDWGREHGATVARVGGEAPFYLWPGIDVRFTPALALFESLGYGDHGAILDLSCSTSVRAAVPAGVEVRRALSDEDAEAIEALVAGEWPWWVPEQRRAVDHGSCFGAWQGQEVVGFGCHSVNRAGWIGPLGTTASRRTGGVGAAVLAALCADLSSAGLRRAEIAWIGPVGFYLRAADAHVSRVFQVRAKPLA